MRHLLSSSGSLALFQNSRIRTSTTTSYLPIRLNLNFYSTIPSITNANTPILSKLQQLQALKHAAKQRRRDLYNAKISRRLRLPARRNVTQKNTFKNQFHAWFDPLTRKQLYLDREARRLDMPWKIRVGVMLERLPVIMEDVPVWEKEYEDLSKELEWKRRKVYPSDLVVEYPKDPKSTSVKDKEEDITQNPPSKDFNVTSLRVSAADRSGFLQTRDRKLQTRIYLAIRPDNDTGWTLPIVDLYPNNKETILDAAKRAVTSTTGSSLKIWCFSNCPLGIDVLPYNSQRQSVECVFGEKLFYMRVQCISGDPQKEEMKSLYDDWAWLDKGEMMKRVKKEKGEERSLFYHYLL